jgi:23S rRNA pseudouridine1911/1915/1917 synthase
VPVPLIRYQDERLLVVEKPAGMLAHPVAAGQGGTLADWVRAHCDGEAHLVGRLDRDTSGLVLVARTAAVRGRLDRQLARRLVRRGYRAVVAGTPRPSEGVVDAPIGRDASDPPLRAVVPDGVPARTRYRVLECFPRASLIELELETGRTHQIRVHMAHIGHPLLGDRWYGGIGLELIDRQALHAHRLAFPGPSGAEIVFESPLPDDIVLLIDQTRKPTAE